MGEDFPGKVIAWNDNVLKLTSGRWLIRVPGVPDVSLTHKVEP